MTKLYTINPLMLEVVGAAAEKLARETGRSVSELTLTEVMTVTGGSAGYVAAHLKTIKNAQGGGLNGKGK